MAATSLAPASGLWGVDRFTAGAEAGVRDRTAGVRGRRTGGGPHCTKVARLAFRSEAPPRLNIRMQLKMLVPRHLPIIASTSGRFLHSATLSGGRRPARWP